MWLIAKILIGETTEFVFPRFLLAKYPILHFAVQSLRRAKRGWLPIVADKRFVGGISSTRPVPQSAD